MFVLHMAEVGEVVASHGRRLHQYADDSQICRLLSKGRFSDLLPSVLFALSMT